MLILALKTGNSCAKALEMPIHFLIVDKKKYAPCSGTSIT
jgi:hypothetical protein